MKTIQLLNKYTFYMWLLFIGTSYILARFCDDTRLMNWFVSGVMHNPYIIGAEVFTIVTHWSVLRWFISFPDERKETREKIREIKNIVYICNSQLKTRRDVRHYDWRSRRNG